MYYKRHDKISVAPPTPCLKLQMTQLISGMLNVRVCLLFYVLNVFY